tara:strand:- start:66 stop:317 length:252 start_codon:yes stop_codon:yes gene_type:complete
MNTPVKKFAAGGIHVAIWENAVSDGKSYYTVSMERRYKNKQDQWKGTNSFRIADLPKAIAALERAYEHLIIKEPTPELHVNTL